MRSRLTFIALGISLLLGNSQAARSSDRRTLSFAERVGYQYAIEEVYWRHRIWPKENPNPKPSLDEVMSRAQIEKKVEDSLRNSQVLADQLHRPITSADLQAEMDRMTSHTKQPDVLRELFAALNNDPFVIAECLARPILVDRLVSVRNNVEAFAAANTWGLSISAPISHYKLPEIAPLDCADDTWRPTTLTNAPAGRSDHKAVWTGSEMIVWGGYNSAPFLNTGGRYNPITDSWIATTTTNAPAARYDFTAVWTGSEMIVWGGEGGTGDLNTGGRYNPASDTWAAATNTNAPSARAQHKAVWTGSEMIVWGGVTDPSIFPNTGRRYNPITDSWIATTTANAPSGRGGHTTVWTGSEMIVWGGANGSSFFNTGGRYDPATDSWIATATANAPEMRIFHTAVWTGNEMIVWGGYHDGSDQNTGGRYDPTTDTWTATSTTNAPSGRHGHTAVWTGSAMVVWGAGFNTGGRYYPSTNGWTATNTTNAPSVRGGDTAVWTGSEMIICGGSDASGYSNTGGRYCVQSPAPQSAFSRKTHGAAGTFDVPLAFSDECRSGGATNDHQMIINFANSVTVGNASVTSGIGSVSSFSVSGSQVTVNLTGVTNVQSIAVMLFNVNDGTHMSNIPISMRVLIGDVNGDATVNAADVAQTKSRLGQTVDATNFRSDVNANGSINAGDVSIVKANLGTGLP